MCRRSGDTRHRRHKFICRVGVGKAQDLLLLRTAGQWPTHALEISRPDTLLLDTCVLCTFSESAVVKDVSVRKLFVIARQK